MTGIKQAERRLLSAIAEGHIPHACFISCADYDMAEVLAKKAAALYCTGTADASRLAHTADCIIPSNYKADTIRAEIIGELANSSFSGGRRAVLLINAHTIQENVQNLLLKSIEEPPQNTLFLLTGNPAGLLPTIRSRCATVLCGTPSKEEIAAELINMGADSREAALFAAQGSTLSQAKLLWQSEDHRALRRASQDVLMELLSGKLPFEKQQTVASLDGARFMLSFMRDVLTFHESGAINENPDRADDIRAISSRFTTGRINCIIEWLVSAMERLDTNASAAGTFTRLFTEITEEFIHND
ncbi:MAG: hypothetical protein IJ941_01680 [Clostridia bacterium]|nr:hypothetical protein [Clostridia bacterium]